MKISYGTPGHRGVTHLVAVGDDVDAATTTIEKTVSGAGLAVAFLGALVGSSRAFWAGAGVCGGILVVRRWRSRRTVTITTP